MKKMFLILLFASQVFAQSSLLTLFDDASYDVDAKLYFTVATSLSPAQKIRVNTFVKMLKDSLSITSLSSKFDVIYLMANEDSVSSKLNLVKRSDDGVKFNTLSFTQWEGWTGDVAGNFAYMNTTYNPSTEATNYAQNSNAFGVYVRNNLNVNVACGNTLPNNYIYPRLSDKFYFTNNVTAAGNQSITNTDSRGFFISSRTAAAVTNGYKNGVSLAENTTVSAAPASANFYIFARNNGAAAEGYSQFQISFFFIGGGLTAIQARQLNNCVEWYMDDLGKGVE